MNLFKDSINDPKNAFYTFVGRPYPWPDDAHPLPANNSLIQYEQSIYKDLVYGKLIAETDVKPMIVRNEWVANTVYDAYNQNDGELFDRSNFYVFTDEKNVFKCIFNNENGPSLIKPTLKSVDGVFSTSDGYIWKYMYTIDDTSQSRFSSNDFIVVLPNTAVESAALPGSLDYIKIEQAGIEYTAVSQDYLANYVNTGVVEIAESASSVDNIYTDSSIYLYSGPGANQIRKIKHYDGLNRLVYVDQPLDAYVTAQIANNQGQLFVNQTLFQIYDSVSILYKKGYFDIGDIIAQSDTGASGTVLFANSTTLTVQRSNFSLGFSPNVPIFNTIAGGTLKTGNASIVSGSLNVVGIGTQFNDSANGYTVGEYIRVGSAANSNIRRITGITNSTFMTVSYPFSNTLSANSHYKMSTAFEPNSISVHENKGTITHLNLSGVMLTYGNNAISSSYIPGELVNMVDGAGVNLGANAIVAFANSSTLVLADVNGSFSNNYFVYGTSSSQKSNIVDIVSFPSVTIKSDSRTLFSGQTAFAADTDVSPPTGNVVIVSSHSIPNQRTQYRISPTVAIEGDGVGAKAFAVVNTSQYSSYGISSIQMIDGGVGYTEARATVSANSLYGSGAEATPVIGPIDGHGANTLLDLGARYLCISTKFDSLVNEQYRLPSSGTYRRIGIIKNPEFDDVIVSVSNSSQVHLTIANKLGNFNPNDIVIQLSSNSAGTIVTGNSTFLELKNVQGSFVSNTAGDGIISLSGGTANSKFSDVIDFAILSNNQPFIQKDTQSKGIIEQIIDHNTLKLTSVTGRLANGSTIFDPSTNAHARVTGIKIANGNIEQSIGYGKYFNVISRVTLSSNTIPFLNMETVQQEVTGAYGTVLDSSSDLDISYSSANGTFNFGNTISDDNTGATATVLFANSTVLKLTNVAGNINTGDTFINNLSKGATVTGVYPVLKLFGTSGKIQVGGYKLTGNTSGSVAEAAFANTVTYSDLVKDSGDVLYLDNVIPFTKTDASKENIRLVLKF